MSEKNPPRKYEFIWQGMNRNVLEIRFLENVTWSDILEANLAGLEMIRREPQNIVLFNNSQLHKVDQVAVGKIKDLLFDSLPRINKNLKGVVILVAPSQKIMLEIGIETIADVGFGKGFMRVVDTNESAWTLIQQMLSR